MVKKTYCRVILCLNIKRLGFRGEPVTRLTRQSRPSMSHVGT